MHEHRQLLLDTVDRFYSRELKLDVEYDQQQLMAICGYNFSRLKSFTPEWETDGQLDSLVAELGVMFSMVNEMELFMVRMESVNLEVTTKYDWLMVRELEDDLCDSMLDTIKRRWRVDYAYDTDKKVRKAYDRLVQVYPKLFMLYPCLWMVPFLNQLHTEYLSKRRR